MPIQNFTRQVFAESLADAPNGFKNGIQRAVPETCDQLKFEPQAFEG